MLSYALIFSVFMSLVIKGFEMMIFDNRHGGVNEDIETLTEPDTEL